MRRTGRLYVVVLAFLALLTLVSGIAGNIAAAQLPSWVEPLLPWIWPVLGLLGVTTVVLAIVQARLDIFRDHEPVTQPIYLHVDIPPQINSVLLSLSKPKVCTNLPQPDYSVFVGRERELAHVQRILRPYPQSQEHLVTIDGVGGVGKSALALEVAHRYLRDYDTLPDSDRFEAIIWASAKTTVLTADGVVSRPQITRTLEDIYTTISIVLERTDITRAHANERDGLVAKALTAQRTLLVVDNLETIDDDRVNTFLRELPAPTKAIVTTRYRIDVAYPVRLTGMSREEGQQLIVLECQKKGVMLNKEQTLRLYDRTGGVPLALTWSIGQMGYGHDSEAVLRRLGNPQDDIGRFCFEGSIERITDKAALQLLRALAVFATDASREAVGRVTGLDDDILTRDEGLVELERLSLINKSNSRFWLLPLTKAYVVARFPDEWAYRLRQEMFYLEFSTRHGGSTENWKQYSSLDVERPNIIGLGEWCLRNRRWQTIADLQDRLWSYWELRSYWSEQERWCQNALKALSEIARASLLDADNQRKQGTFHLALCWVRLNQDRFDEAIEETTHALKILEPIQDAHGIAVAYRHRGLIEKLLGESELAQQHRTSASQHFAKSEEFNNRALEIWQSLGNERECSSILANMGHLMLAQDKLPEARRLLEQALDIRRRLKDVSRLSTTLKGLGQVAERERKSQIAAIYYSEAREIAKQIDDKQGSGEAILGLASVSLLNQEYRQAISLATEALGYLQALNETDFLCRDIAQADDIIRLAENSMRK